MKEVIQFGDFSHQIFNRHTSSAFHTDNFCERISFFESYSQACDANFLENSASSVTYMSGMLGKLKTDENYAILPEVKILIIS